MRSLGKKNFIITLAAGLTLLLCAACGGSGGAAAESPLFSTPEPAPTEEPAVTASPAPTETPEPEAEAVSAVRLSEADSESAPDGQAAGGASAVNTTVNSGASTAAARQEESRAEETPAPDIITADGYQVEICYGEPTEPPSEVDILAPNQPDYEVGPPN